MKPANFPGRKNVRRKSALARLNARLEIAPGHRLTDKMILTSRVVPDDMARAIRTKKDRSARGKLRS